jgi:hypothetical protein
MYHKVIECRSRKKVGAFVQITCFCVTRNPLVTKPAICSLKEFVSFERFSSKFSSNTEFTVSWHIAKVTYAKDAGWR